MRQATEPPREIEAEYDLEVPVSCPHCDSLLERLHVVRLLRTRVNFTSSLPRRGCVVVCPDCGKMLPAILGSRTVL